MDGNDPKPEEIVGGGVPPVTSAASKNEFAGIEELPVMLIIPDRLAVDTVGAVKFIVVTPLTATVPRGFVPRVEKNDDANSCDNAAENVPFGSCTL